jgi:hypothetical protein
MNEVKKDHEKYKSVISVYNPKQYEVDTDQLDNDEEITCPDDSTMKFAKNADGSISIKKQAKFLGFLSISRSK